MILKSLFCKHKYETTSSPNIIKIENGRVYWRCNEECFKCDKKRAFKSWFSEELM